eukprot:2317075-Prymnesium_polylepis.1
MRCARMCFNGTSATAASVSRASASATSVSTPGTMTLSFLKPASSRKSRHRSRVAARTGSSIQPCRAQPFAAAPGIVIKPSAQARRSAVRGHCDTDTSRAPPTRLTSVVM